jgi:hypothetical protein
MIDNLFTYFMNSQQARQSFNQFISEGDEEASQSIKNRANQFSLNEEPDKLATNPFNPDEEFGVSNSFSGESLYNFSANTGQTKVKPKLDGVEAQAIFDLVNSHEGAMVNNGANLLITSGGKKLFETDEKGMVTFAIAQHDQNFSRRQSPLSNSMELLKGAMQAYGAVEGRTKSDLEVNEKLTQNPQAGNTSSPQNPQAGNNTPTHNPRAGNTSSPQNPQAGNNTLTQNPQAENSPSPQNLEVGNSPSPQNLEAENSPSPQNLEAENSPSPQNLEAENSPLSQNLEVENTPLPQNPQAENTPPPQNLEAKNNPSPQNPQAENTSPPQNLEVKNTSPPQNLEIENTPLSQNLEIENTPLSQNLEIENTPLSQNLEIENTPPPQNLEIENSPSSQNLEAENSPSPQNPQVENSPSPQNSQAENSPSPQNPQVGNTLPVTSMIPLLGTDRKTVSITREDLNTLGKYYASKEYKQSNPGIDIRSKTDPIHHYKSDHINGVRANINDSKLSVHKINRMTPSPEAEITMKNEDIQNIEIAKQWQEQEKVKVNTEEKEASQAMGI